MTLSYTPAESLHRLAKEAIDRGAAESVEEAAALLQQYTLQFEITPEQAFDRSAQGALLTGVALARRVFLGGVTVVGKADVPLLIPLPLGCTLADAVCALGGKMGVELDRGKPLVTIGGGPRKQISNFHIRTVHGGWRGGVLPVEAPNALVSNVTMPLAPMLAVALAINEAFLHVRKETPAAGLRTTGFSLWRTEPGASWLDNACEDPHISMLPSRLWLIGLGHLGQAYLWALGLLPYETPTDLELVLQDVDDISPSTESTSILSDASLIGQKKTRAMAAWAERRGFSTKVHERIFDSSFARQDSEPSVALCGLDNALGRQSLDQVGFDIVFEAGLGRGYRDFRTIRAHTLPTLRPASEIWPNIGHEEDNSNRPAYTKLIRDGVLDQCGTTMLAGKAVGAPFVGAVAACVVVAGVLRQLHGGDVDQIVDLDLQDLSYMSVVPQYRSFEAVNPGYVACI